MRGSGKTSELAKYAQKLSHHDCFLVITCNIDLELDMNNIEYMDILIFQLEKLIQHAARTGINLDKSIVKSFNDWFAERVNEVNKSTKREAEINFEISASTPKLWTPILKILGGFTAGITGSAERATIIRQVLKYKFNEFAHQFNKIIEEVNKELRSRRDAQEILFIIDGLEKTMTPELRRKIILEESNRLQQIKANTIFTLPIELMREHNRLMMFSKVYSFPYVKLVEKDGKKVKRAIERFKEFVYKRIAKELFENEEVVERAILMGGGSPRELLRLLEYCGFYADDEGKIDEKTLTKAIQKLAADTARYITEEELNALKKIRDNNEKGLDTPFDETVQDMMEKLILMEYNDGTYKRVHPIVAESNLYKQYVNGSKSSA